MSEMEEAKYQSKDKQTSTTDETSNLEKDYSLENIVKNDFTVSFTAHTSAYVKKMYFLSCKLIKKYIYMYPSDIRRETNHF